MLPIHSEALSEEHSEAPSEEHSVAPSEEDNAAPPLVAVADAALH